MKKVSFFITSLLIVAFIVSCEKESMDDSQIIPSGEQMSALKAKPVFYQPDSREGITPEIITGANEGGNVTCEEVEAFFGVDFDLCGDKVDYGNFATGFPNGIAVTVNKEEKSLSFELTLEDNPVECIPIEVNGKTKYYKIGAVIVKGGPAANVYLYDLDDDGIVEGISADGGLTAPNGKMISNLTFCFVECEEIIAIKLWYYNYSGENPETSIPWQQDWAASRGDYILSPPSDSWCQYLGINDFKESESDIVLLTGRTENEVGTAHITTGENPTVTITLDPDADIYLYSTHIFVGTREKLINLAGEGCPAYFTDTENWIIDDTYGGGVNLITIDL